MCIKINDLDTKSKERLLEEIEDYDPTEKDRTDLASLDQQHLARVLADLHLREKATEMSARDAEIIKTLREARTRKRRQLHIAETEAVQKNEEELFTIRGQPMRRAKAAKA
jgi:hypothetical protein